MMIVTSKHVNKEKLGMKKKETIIIMKINHKDLVGEVKDIENTVRRKLKNMGTQ